MKKISLVLAIAGLFITGITEAQAVKKGTAKTDQQPAKTTTATTSPQTRTSPQTVKPVHKSSLTNKSKVRAHTAIPADNKIK